MSTHRLSGIHQTILVAAVTVAALIGSVAGALGAVVMTGAISASDVLGRATSGDNLAGVDRRIVELIEEESATISVVDNVVPSVVSVLVRKPTRAGDGFVDVGGGTGFFLSSDGFVVTNRHVVAEEDAAYVVVTSDGAELPARVVARDAYLDIAVLDVEGDGYPAATLGDSGTLRIGQTVIAIGNTLSEYRNTVTKGVVSGINRRVTAGDYGETEVIERAIQTDAAINPGNSGGPLINLLGEVVGVNTAVSYEGQSIGFAIPVDDVKSVADDIARYGRIVRPWLGVRYFPLDADVAAERGLAYETGALLVDGLDERRAPAVSPGSPADKAGLREGDILLTIDGAVIDDDHSLLSLLADREPGEAIRLRVARGDEMLEIEVFLAELK